MTTFSSLLGLPLPELAQTDWKQPEDEVKTILDFVVFAILSRNRIVDNGGVVTDGGGLTADYSSHLVEVDSKRYSNDAGSVVLGAAPAGLEELRFVYVDGTGSVQGTINQPTGQYTPLGAVYVSDTAIMRVADLRPMNAVSVGNNLLINPEFNVNQLGYAADGVATLDDGIYGHDLWRNMTGSTQKYIIDGSGNIDLDGIELAQKNDNILAVDGETVTFSVESGEVQFYGLGITEWTTVSPTSPYTWALDATGNSGFLKLKKSGANTFKRPKLEPGYVSTRFVSRDIRVEKIMCYGYFWEIQVSFLVGKNVVTCYAPVSFPVEMRATPTCTVTDFVDVDNSAANSVIAVPNGATGILAFNLDAAPGTGDWRFRIKFRADANYYT